MKYIVRAIKYFLYIVVLVTLVLGVLATSGFISSDVNVMFRNGWKSVYLILAVFACVSAFYPRLGYGKRQANIAGEYGDIRGGIIEYMSEHGYRLEKEDGENLSFRCRSVMKQVLRVWEDRITMERCLGGFVVEGPLKDMLRLVSGLEYKFRGTEE